MKIQALVTSFVLGLSSIAAAAPATRGPTVRDHRTPTARDHRAPIVQAPVARPTPMRPAATPHRGHWIRPQPARWQVLETASARRNGRNVISVDGRRSYSKLKLDVTRGQLRIDRVEITFGNGRTQRVELDRRLGANAAPTIIDLAGDQRHITQIVVYTEGRSRASYTVLAV